MVARIFNLTQLLPRPPDVQRAVGCCPLQAYSREGLHRAWQKEGLKVPAGWEGSRGIPWSRANDCVTNKTIAHRVTPPEFPSPNRKLELDARHQIFWPVSDRLPGDRAPDAIFPQAALSPDSHSALFARGRPWGLATALLLACVFASCGLRLLPCMLHDEQR